MNTKKRSGAKSPHRPSDGLTDEQLCAFRRWTLAAGVESLLLFPPLVPPRLYERFYESNNRLSRLLRLGGAEAVPPEEGINKLFVNLNGLLGSAMGAALIYSAADPRNRWGIPLVSAIERLAAVALISYYLRTENVNRLMLLLSVPDLIFASAFIYYAAKSRGAGN